MDERSLNHQRGFTLIEMIAVLVILGILAAIAVPKYFNLQEEAKKRTAYAALGEGRSRINQFGMQKLLNTSSFPGGAEYTGSAVGTDAGDFTIAYSYTSPVFTITATGKASTSVANATAVGTMKRPGL